MQGISENQFVCRHAVWTVLNIDKEGAGMLDCSQMPICFCKPFSCKTCLRTCRIQNQDIPWAGRGDAAQDRAAVRRGIG